MQEAPSGGRPVPFGAAYSALITRQGCTFVGCLDGEARHWSPLRKSSVNYVMYFGGKTPDPQSLRLFRPGKLVDCPPFAKPQTLQSRTAHVPEQPHPGQPQPAHRDRPSPSLPYSLLKRLRCSVSRTSASLPSTQPVAQQQQDAQAGLTSCFKVLSPGICEGMLSFPIKYACKLFGNSTLTSLPDTAKNGVSCT